MIKVALAVMRVSTAMKTLKFCYGNSDACTCQPVAEMQSIELVLRLPVYILQISPKPAGHESVSSDLQSKLRLLLQMID